MSGNVDLLKVKKEIMERFNLDELRSLCFDLQIDFDAFPRSGKENLVEALLSYCQRQNRIEELLQVCTEKRPGIAWTSFVKTLPVKDEATEITPPYKGLHYYDVTDADIYYGQEQFIASCMAHLEKHNFLAIVGSSGCGKSSLARAGLMASLLNQRPSLNGRPLPPHNRTWPIHLITPTAAPLETLAATLTHDSESLQATTQLLDDLRADNRSLHLFLRRYLKTYPGQQFVLIIDQFEELFTQCKDSVERERFVTNLTLALQQPSPFLIVIILLRADFYNDCLQYDVLRLLLELQQKIVPPIDESDIRRIIEGPAEKHDLVLETGLVNLLLDDVQKEPGALPLLSHALMETWRNRQGNQLTIAGYIQSGGVQKAITKTADEVYKKLTTDQQRIAKKIFLRLVEIREDSPYTRRRALFTELNTIADVESLKAIYDKLADVRLITLKKDGIEIAHEALIRRWPRYGRWQEENKDGLRIHRRLSDAAKEWEHEWNRDPNELYRGGRLLQAEEWFNTQNPSLSPLESEFLQASISRYHQEQAEKEARQKEALAQAKEIADANKRAAKNARRLLVVVGLVSIAVIFVLWNEFSSELLRQRAIGLGTTVTLPNTTMLLGDSTAGDGDTASLPYKAYTVAPFRIEIYEVTNERYNLCIDAGACSRPNAPENAYRDPERGNYPITYVSAIQALEFCQWIGRTLPTDLQWERAARSGGNLWPWGNTPPSSQVAHLGYDEAEEIQEVGLLSGGTTPEGVYDLVGNVAEWTRTNYIDPTQNWFDVSSPPPSTLSVRGGSAAFILSSISYREAARATLATNDIGFRCVTVP